MRRPWIHFLLIGAALFVVQELVPGATTLTIDGVSGTRIEEIRGEWLQSTGTLPTEPQLQNLVELETDQQLLFEEALRRGWHLIDPVVQQRLLRNMRFIEPEMETVDAGLVIAAALDLQLHRNDLIVERRLIQRMEQAAYASVRNREPDETELRTIYDSETSDYMRPATVSFDHVYISSDRNENALAVVRRLADEVQSLTMSEAKDRGDPFVHGQSFGPISHGQVARLFGEQFAAELFSLQTPEGAGPLGPLTSSYGEHLVWIRDLKPAAVREYAEVRSAILREWRRRQEWIALETQLAALRSNYRVRL